MSLRKAMGNMYDFSGLGLPEVHTWNPIKGACKHNCPYCYVQKGRAKYFYQGEPYLDEKQFEVNLGRNKTVFVCNCNDLFGEWIPILWIIRVIHYCNKYPDNIYYFQTKNPGRFLKCKEKGIVFPKNTIYCATIESCYNMSYLDRVKPMIDLQGRKSITIEPIMDFDVDTFVNVIKNIKPEFVTIGADSKHCGLPEPSAGKVLALIRELKKFTRVVIKDNLKRIIGEV